MSIILGILLLLFCIFYKQIRVFYIGLTKHRRIQRNLYLGCKRENFLILNDNDNPENLDFNKIDILGDTLAKFIQQINLDSQ